MMAVRTTPVDTLLKLQKVAEDNGMHHVYVGNVLTDDGSNTYCPECGEMVIRRTGYRVHVSGLSGNRCSYCGHRLNIIR
jgi:pyruvate formate lyase activating enzyme